MSSSNIPTNFDICAVETKRLPAPIDKLLANPPVTFLLGRMRVYKAPPVLHLGVPENLTENFVAGYLRYIATMWAVEKVISGFFIIRDFVFFWLYLLRFFEIRAVIRPVIILVTLITSLWLLT